MPLCVNAFGQSYPVKPVRAILPAGTGTPTDLTGRAIGQAIAPHLGQQIIIENRVGANGIIGIEACMKSAPDGYTLCLVANAQIGLNPFVYANTLSVIVRNWHLRTASLTAWKI